MTRKLRDAVGWFLLKLDNLVGRKQVFHDWIPYSQKVIQIVSIHDHRITIHIKPEVLLIATKWFTRSMVVYHCHAECCGHDSKNRESGLHIVCSKQASIPAPFGCLASGRKNLEMVVRIYTDLLLTHYNEEKQSSKWF